MASALARARDVLTGQGHDHGSTDLVPSLQFLEVRAPTPALRRAYLDTIPEGQELFVERLVQRGRAWQCGDCAYAVCADSKLFEFYVAGSSMTNAAALYDAALVAAGADGAFVKSFDTLMLTAATRCAASTQELGFLFRRLVDRGPIGCAGLTFRYGTEADISAILGRDDGFFDGAEELRLYIGHGGLFIAEREHRIVGCGLALEVVQGRNDVDVGMWVAPGERGRGFSAAIMSHVIGRQLEAGLRPIAGCDASNVASRKALERAGFAADHRLLSITNRHR